MAPNAEDDPPPVLVIGWAPNERSRERRCIFPHESKVLAESYGFQHRDLDYDGDMHGLLQKLVVDIRRDEFESVDVGTATPLVEMVVLGDVFVGKTSLVNRLLTGEFEGKYTASVPSRARKIKIVVDELLTILRLRDTPGIDYANMITTEFMSAIHSALIVYDVNSRTSFEAALRIHQLVLSAKQDRRISIMLIGNKSDEQFMVPRQVTYQEGANVAKTWKCPFFEVSCKSVTVDHIFQEAIREYRLIFNYDAVSAPKQDWAGFVQVSVGRSGSTDKFSKKWVSVKSGKLLYSSKADSSNKNLRTYQVTADTAVIEGHHEKGFLLLVSFPATPSSATTNLQCLLPTNAERAAFADALFAEIGFQKMVNTLLEETIRSVIVSTQDTTPLCILAHGRLTTLAQTTTSLPSTDPSLSLPLSTSLTSAPSLHASNSLTPAKAVSPPIIHIGNSSSSLAPETSTSNTSSSPNGPFKRSRGN